MISKRKGKICISKELYDSEEINDVLFKLEMKIYKIEYLSFLDQYEIYFTSKYLIEVPESSEPQEVVAEKTTYGFHFKEKE